jgi:hypothetical protein
LLPVEQLPLFRLDLDLQAAEVNERAGVLLRGRPQQFGARVELGERRRVEQGLDGVGGPGLVQSHGLRGGETLDLVDLGLGLVDLGLVRPDLGLDLRDVLVQSQDRHLKVGDLLVEIADLPDQLGRVALEILDIYLERFAIRLDLLEAAALSGGRGNCRKQEGAEESRGDRRASLPFTHPLS